MSVHNVTKTVVFALSVAVAASLLTGCASSNTGAATNPSSGVGGVAKDNALHDMLPASIKSSGVLKVGTEAFYPPFEYLDTDNTTVIGLDMDLFNAVGTELGVKTEVTNMAFDGLLPALDGGRIDVVAAAMTDTKARQAKYDFVDYFLTGQGIVVLKGNPKHISDISDLCGLTVAALDASVQQTLLEGFNKKECATHPITVLAMAKDSDAMLQVQSGRAQASFSQDAVARFNVKSVGGGDKFEVANKQPLLPVVTGPMFTKANSQLRDAVKAAVEKLIKDGTYAEILKKNNVSSGSIPEVTINGGTL